MELEKLGLKGMSLMDGEYLDLTLSLRHGLSREPRPGEESLLLTNKRVIQLAGSGRRQEATFAALRDIQAAEVKNSSRRMASLIWGILGLIASLILSLVINASFENVIASVIAGVGVGLLGVFLIVDYFLSSEQALLTLQAGSAQLQGHLQRRNVSRDAYTFINRLFQLKTGEGSPAQEMTYTPTPESPSPDEGWAPRLDPRQDEPLGTGDDNPPMESPSPDEDWAPRPDPRQDEPLGTGDDNPPQRS